MRPSRLIPVHGHLAASGSSSPVLLLLRHGPGSPSRGVHDLEESPDLAEQHEFTWHELSPSEHLCCRLELGKQAAGP